MCRQPDTLAEGQSPSCAYDTEVISDISSLQTRIMPASENPFSEHVRVMKALYQEYQKKDDLDNVSIISSVTKDMANFCNQQNLLIRDMIKGAACCAN